MKKILTIALFFISAGALAQKANDNFAGKWKADEGKFVVVTKSGNSFTGVTADKNFIMLSDVKFTDGKWKGTIIRPEDGAKANCELMFEDGKLKIVAHKGIFSKTIYWTRV